MDKKRYIPKLVDAAKQYNDYLLNKTFLIIGQSPGRPGYDFIEVIFLDRHFMHLTGVKAIMRDENTGEDIILPANRFFEMCLGNMLSANQFIFSYESTLKLDVLPNLCNFTRNAKMMGSYNNTGNFLSTGKVAGTVSACMGFVVEDGNPYLVPNTALQCDIRTIVNDLLQIVAIYEKPISQALYPARPTYLAKALKPYANRLRWPDEIMKHIVVGSE